MASPQTENGYTRVANELLEALARTQLTGCTHQLLAVVFRKTYGFNKKEDAISISQFMEATNLSRRSVIYGLQELEAKRILLIRRGDHQANVVRFNKDYETWAVHHSAPQVKVKRDRAKYASAQLRTGAQLRQEVVHNSVKTSAHAVHPQKTIQKKVTKDTSAAKAAEEEFSFSGELEKLKNGSRKDYKIIALYWIEKRWQFTNKQQLGSALRRELRPAKDLLGYSGQQITQAIAYCKKEWPDKWTLETVAKRITDVTNSQ